MFTLAGEVMTLGGVSDKLIYLANRVVGRFKGGLSMVTTLACMFFGAISGSAAHRHADNRYGRCHRRHHGRAHGKSRL